MWTEREKGPALEVTPIGPATKTRHATCVERRPLLPPQNHVNQDTAKPQKTHHAVTHASPRGTAKNTHQCVLIFFQLPWVQRCKSARKLGPTVDSSKCWEALCDKPSHPPELQVPLGIEVPDFPSAPVFHHNRIHPAMIHKERHSCRKPELWKTRSVVILRLL